MSHLITKLNRLRMEKELCDVVLKIGEEKYHCHRIILASVSDYFETMFKSPNFIEHNLNEIPLVDFDRNSFQIFLNWAYTGNAIVTPHNVTDVLIMARRLLCEVLAEFLESYVIGNACCFSAVDYYMFSLNNEFPKLTKFYAEYLETNFWYIVQNRTYVKLPFEIFKNCLACVDMDEKSKFQTITNWVEYDMIKRSDYFGDLIKCIRFKELSPYFVFNWLSNHQEVVLKPVFQDRIDEQPRMCIVACITEAKIVKVFSCDSGNSFDKWLDGLCGMDYEMIKDMIMRISVLKKEIFVLCDDIFRHFSPLSESIVEWKNAAPPNIFRTGSMVSIDRMNKIFLSTDSPMIDFYNADLDTWSPVSEMCNNDISMQTLVAIDNALYLCGGGCTPKLIPSSVISLYDYRVPKFQDVGCLTIPTVYSAGCVFNNSIYITGGRIDPDLPNKSAIVQRYDITAGKTDIVQSMIHKKIEHSAVSYNNKIWAAGLNEEFEVYDIKQNEWKVVDWNDTDVIDVQKVTDWNDQVEVMDVFIME